MSDVIYKSDLYRSEDVAINNGHKLYYIDIVKEGEKFRLYGYAQLVDGSGVKGPRRGYDLGHTMSFASAKNELRKRISKKTKTRGYASIRNRNDEREDIVIDPVKLVAFLNKHYHAVL